MLKEVKPLHQNSSLKKRRDEKLFNRQNVKVGANSVSINFQNVVDGKNTKLKQDPKYVFSAASSGLATISAWRSRLTELSPTTAMAVSITDQQAFLTSSSGLP